MHLVAGQALGEPVQHAGTLEEGVDDPVADGEVVVDQVELGGAALPVSGGGEVDPVGVADAHDPVVDLDLDHRLRADPVTRAIPVIAVTASAMTQDRRQILAAGFDGYQSKPINVKDFLVAVRAMLEDAGAAPSAIAGDRTGLVYATAAAYAPSNRDFIAGGGTLHFAYTAPAVVPAEVAIEFGLAGPYGIFLGGSPATLRATLTAWSMSA